MSHKLHVIIDDSQYGLLKDVSAEGGASIGELVRRAIERVYRSGTDDEKERRLQALKKGAGAWSRRSAKDDPYAEVRQLRRKVKTW